MMTSRTRVPNHLSLLQLSEHIKYVSRNQYEMTEADARNLISYMIALFRNALTDTGNYKENQVRPVVTKFRDAGRRSAPWRPTSNRVPGRPQDGADGNRINRWLLPPDHKFYADEITATLVEVKYFLQTLSMSDAPQLPKNSIQKTFGWLLGHDVEPGVYLDPIQLIPISLREFLKDPRLIQSGHLTPLDRGGKHTPDNTFLMLARSNQIQGNQTLEELVALMERVVTRYRNGDIPSEITIKRPSVSG